MTFQICFVSTVATIGLRCDFVSFLYALWFVVLLVQRRGRLARLWRYYIIFLAILLPLQYLACVGIPPSICSSKYSAHWARLDGASTHGDPRVPYTTFRPRVVTQNAFGGPMTPLTPLGPL